MHSWWPRQTWDWIHPSYRDLVINHLNSDSSFALRYLRLGGISSILLALSEKGGLDGKRDFPMMHHDRSWNVLSESLLDLITSKPTETFTRVAQTLLSLKASQTFRSERREVSLVLIEAVRLAWNSQQSIIPAGSLKLYYALAKAAGEYAFPPNLNKTWLSAVSALEAAAKVVNVEHGDFDIDAVVEWQTLHDMLQQQEPRFMEVMADPAQVEVCAAIFLSVAADEIDTHAGSASSLDEIETAIESINEIYLSVEGIAHGFSNLEHDLAVLEKEKDRRVNRLEERRGELSIEHEPDPDDLARWREQRTGVSTEQEILGIFSDL